MPASSADYAESWRLPFRPAAPWWGADLQTLRNRLRRRPADVPGGRRLTLPLRDGGSLAARLDRPQKVTDRPLVLLLHGLAGSEDSRYMVLTARHLLAAGFPVLRLNLRGAGPSRHSASGHYHAGLTADLRAAVDALPCDLLTSGLALAGFSLGGNMLLKYLGEDGMPVAVTAACAVSAPIDLAAASRRITAPRNRLYHRFLLRQLQEEALAKPEELSDTERGAILGARTIRAFDDGFIAPRFGFAGVDAYYREASAKPRLRSIGVPTLIIHAQDDPWIPVADYLDIDWAASTSRFPILPASGGHVGFHAQGLSEPWYAQAMAAFFAHPPSIAAPSPVVFVEAED